MKRTGLKDVADVSSTSLARMSKDEYVSMEILVHTCKDLSCDIGDIAEVVRGEP